MSEYPQPEKRQKSAFGLILHLHPGKVKASTLQFNLTSGIGVRGLSGGGGSSGSWKKMIQEAGKKMILEAGKKMIQEAA